jgi:hypothetical protein
MVRSISPSKKNSRQPMLQVRLTQANENGNAHVNRRHLPTQMTENVRLYRSSRRRVVIAVVGGAGSGETACEDEDRDDRLTNNRNTPPTTSTTFNLRASLTNPDRKLSYTHSELQKNNIRPCSLAHHHHLAARIPLEIDAPLLHTVPLPHPTRRRSWSVQILGRGHVCVGKGDGEEETGHVRSLTPHAYFANPHRSGAIARMTPILPGLSRRLSLSS